MKRALKPKNLKQILKSLRMFWDATLWKEIPEERVFKNGIAFMDIILNISGRIKTLGTSNIPTHGKTIFVCNHLDVFDPFYIGAVINWTTGEQRRCASLMRDDYFKSSFLNRRMERYLRTPLFPRGSMKKEGFQKITQKIHENLDRGIVIFTCGTRSKNGEVLYTYSREKGKQNKNLTARKDPGKFIKIILRNFKGRVKLIPTTITYNYMDNGIGLVFGEPILYDSEKDDYRALSRKIEETAKAIENQVYVGFHQLIPLLLNRYIFSGWEGSERNGGFSIAQIKVHLKSALDSFCELYHYTEENLLENFQQRFEKTLEWYRRQNMLKIIDDRIVKICENRALTTPDLDTKFKKKNPFLFYLNQIKGLKLLEEVIDRAYPQLDHMAGRTQFLFAPSSNTAGE